MLNEDEIQVGEFIRTKYGDIGKVENINDFRPPESKYAVDIQAKDLVFIGKDQIAKHSSNIIDLIEVGDYVKLCARLGDKEYVDDVCSYVSNVGEYNGKTFIELDYGQDGTEYFYDTNKIKTIVTHEQISALEYKIGDKYGNKN